MTSEMTKKKAEDYAREAQKVICQAIDWLTVAENMDDVKKVREYLEAESIRMRND